MWVGTFHGLCNRMLRAHYRDAEPAAALPDPGHAGPARADQAHVQGAQHRRRALSRRASCSGSSPTPRRRGCGPNAVEAGDEFTRRQVEHYALYDAMCQREGVVDFAELLLRSYELLAQHEGIREHYRRRFSHLLVDEFQDTNVLQYKWLQLLAGPRHRGVRRRRRRPVDLRVPRRQRRQHAALRARLRQRRAAGAADQARAELPLARPHPRRRQRADPATTRRASARTCGRAKARASRCARSPRRPTSTRRRSSSTWSSGLADDGVRARRDRAALPLATRSRACSSTRCSTRRCRTASTAACASSSAPRSSTRSRTCASSRRPDDDGAFLRVVNFPPRGIGARTLEQLQDRAQRARHHACGRRRRRRARRARRAPRSRRSCG